jgi:hypothetical protein
VEAFDIRPVYGPFHRLLAPGVQDSETVVRQILSGEVWGKPPSWGGSPTVKAYPGRLPDDASGIEFWAFQPPEHPYGPRCYWRTPGAYVTIDGKTEIARLAIAFVRITQDLHRLVP